MLHVLAPQASASVPLPLLSGREAGSWRLFASTPSGQMLGLGGGVSSPEGSHRAGSSSFARLLQPFVYRHEGLGIVAASNGSLAFEPPLYSGIHHPEGCVSASSDTSGIQIVSAVHGVQQSLPIQGSLLWSLRGSSGIHAGHGIWLIQASSRGQVLLSLRTVLRLFRLFRDSHQLGEVSAFVASEDVLPRSPMGLCQFPGLIQPRNDSTKLLLNWLPVSIMHGSTCENLARVDEDVVLSDSAHSGGTAADAVVPVCPSSGLEPFRSRRYCAVVFRDPPVSFLVV